MLKEDNSLLFQWFNNPEFFGSYSDFPIQMSKTQLEKRLLEPKIPQIEWIDFIIQKKDGTPIGWMPHYISTPNFGWVEIGFYLIPKERSKGYGTEATKILVDYLFLTKEAIPRIQAITSINNKPAQRMLTKIGFKREGTLRQALWVRPGTWIDANIYSILRQEWKQPKTLTK